MTVSKAAAGKVADDLVFLMKRMHVLRQQAPRFHPDVDQSAYPSLLLLSHGPQRVSSIAQCVHSDLSTISRQVSALTTAGLAEKVTDPEDGRAFMVALTEAGEAAVRTVRQERAAWAQGLLCDWDNDDVIAFSSYLRRFGESINHQLERHPESPRKENS